MAAGTARATGVRGDPPHPRRGGQHRCDLLGHAVLGYYVGYIGLRMLGADLDLDQASAYYGLWQLFRTSVVSGSG